MNFKKKIICLIIIVFISLPMTAALAQSGTYTVVPGDSMWKISRKYQIGLYELINANPQIKNPNLIYPKQKIFIPNIEDSNAFEREVVNLVNKERASRGLQALRHNTELSRVARLKSQDMVYRRYFSHQSPTYGSPFAMMERYGIRFSAAGENIAYGQRTPSEVVSTWMNSPGHRANILSAVYTDIGVGVAKTSTGVLYWTQMFIKAR